MDIKPQMLVYLVKKMRGIDLTLLGSADGSSTTCGRTDSGGARAASLCDDVRRIRVWNTDARPEKGTLYVASQTSPEASSDAAPQDAFRGVRHAPSPLPPAAPSPLSATELLEALYDAEKASKAADGGGARPRRHHAALTPCHGNARA